MWLEKKEGKENENNDYRISANSFLPRIVTPLE